MPWTSNDLATIDAAIASGMKVCKFADREVVYHNIADLKSARTEILNYLATTTGAVPTVKMVRVYTKSGW